MASYQGTSHSEPAKMEQLITEFFAKSLHIILESRCPYVSSRNYSGEQVLSSPSPSSSSSSSSSFRPRDKWFNLALRDCPSALENIDFWRQSYLEPMIIDVILFRRPSNCELLNFSPKSGPVTNLSGKEKYYYSSDNEEFGSETKRDKIIERWVLEYESKRAGVNSGASSGGKRSPCTSFHALRKKSILLLRSLYATVRLLPAYKLFRDLISSAQIRTYNLGHRVSSFVEPFTLIEEADIERFVFTPVDTSCGRLCLSVMYQSLVLDVSSEPSTPISPQFIPEYVGSPLAEPLKRFPSGPMQTFPSSSPFGRHHSWTYDLYRASSPSANASPSPTYSESYASISKQPPYCFPPANLPRPLPGNTLAVHVKNQSFDEFWHSPTFTPSPTASPPIHTPGSHISKVVLRSESAPVSTLASRRSCISPLPTNQLLPLSPPAKARQPCVVKTEPRSGLYKTSSTADKLFPFGNDEAVRKSGVDSSSNISPSKSFSRSSSRFSYDDSEFSGQFLVDDDDMADPGTRPGSFEQLGPPSGPHERGCLFPGGKSQDAPVDDLVQMLEKAPSLHQDISVTSDFLQVSNIELLKNSIEEPNEVSSTPQIKQCTSSELISSKTTFDALEELRGYGEMKNSLLKQSKNAQA